MLHAYTSLRAGELYYGKTENRKSMKPHYLAAWELTQVGNHGYRDGISKSRHKYMGYIIRYGRVIRIYKDGTIA